MTQQRHIEGMKKYLRLSDRTRLQSGSGSIGSSGKIYRRHRLLQRRVYTLEETMQQSQIFSSTIIKNRGRRQVQDRKRQRSRCARVSQCGWRHQALCFLLSCTHGPRRWKGEEICVPSRTTSGLLIKSESCSVVERCVDSLK